MENAEVKVLAEETLTLGYLRVDRYRLRHQLFDGGMSNDVMREVCLRGAAVAVLLYDPDRDMVVMVEQFRAGAAAGGGPAWLREIVAGVVSTQDVSPEDVAIREAKEEAGAEILAIEPICTYFPSPAILSEKVWVYCGKVDSRNLPRLAGLSEEDEDIRVHVIHADEAIELLDKNKLHNSVAIIGIGWLARHRGRLRQQWTHHK